MFGFDIDGVLYPWHELAYEWAIDALDEDISFDDFWKKDGYFFQNEGSIFIHNIVRNPTLYNKRSMPQYLVNAAWKISDIFQGKVCYITSRPTDVKAYTLSWMRQNKLPNPESVYFSRGEPKDILVKELGVTHFVEDHSKYIKQLEPILTQLFVVDGTFNEHVKLTTAIRVDDISDIPALIRKENV